jgi:hypothetical protein
MPAFLLFLQPAWTLLKPFWKYIAGAIVLMAIVLACAHAWNAAMIAAYKHGVAATVAADAVVLAERQKENDQIISELKISAARKQAELEGKIHENETVATDLRAKLRGVRVCTDSPSGNSGPVAGTTPSASNVNGAPGGSGPIETVGDDLTRLAQSCKNTGDKLITLQRYVKEVQSKLQQAEATYRAAVLKEKSMR